MILSLREEKIYNGGERLIPAVSHDHLEYVRHRSSYQLWYDLINKDIQTNLVTNPKILDLGCGVGYGCKVLAQLPDSVIVGVDLSAEAIDYAKDYYPAENIEYLAADITKLPKKYLDQFDYIVSRGGVGNVEDGINFVIENFSFSSRLMVDQPYEGKPGELDQNYLGLDQAKYTSFSNVEFYVQTQEGEVDFRLPDEASPNMVGVVISSEGFPKVNEFFEHFPLPAWSPETQPNIDIPSRREWFGAENYIAAALEAIKPVDVALELGAGLHHNEFSRSPLQILSEPCDVYIPVLLERVKENDHAIYPAIEQTAQLLLPQLPDKSVDIILLIDVIEHLEKDDGKAILQECERVARHQIVLFTPVGFLPQAHEDGMDIWGLMGGEWQKHNSGWEPGEFDSSWSILGCEDYHEREIEGEMRTFGAFFAIKNLKPEKYASNHIIGGLISAIAENTKKIIRLQEAQSSAHDLLITQINAEKSLRREESEIYQKALTEQRDTIAKLVEDLKTYQSTLAEQRETITYLKAEQEVDHNTLIEQHAKIAQMKADQEALRSELADQSDSLIEQHAKIAQMKADQEALKSELADQSDSLSKLMTDQELYQNAQEEQNTTIGALSGEIESKNITITEQSERISKLEADVDRERTERSIEIEKERTERVQKSSELYQQINEVRYSYYHRIWMRIYRGLSPISQRIKKFFSAKSDAD